MNTFRRLVETRRSIRVYLDKTVPREEIELCIDAARLAPSAENVQPWRFIVVDDPLVREEFCKKAFSGIYSVIKFPRQAPVIIVALAKPDIIANKLGTMIQGTQYYLLDMGIAGEHIVLQALERGLGSCWIGWFNEKGVRDFFNIPQGYKITYLLTLGYFDPKNAIKYKKRRAISDIISYNEFIV